MFLPRTVRVRVVFFALAIAAEICFVASLASAASLESAQMGIPGKTGGVAIVPNGQSALGWRFEVSVPFQVERIGAHLYSSDQQPIYGAIIALDSITSLPAGLPFNQNEVLASTTFIPPSPSDEIILPLSVTLAPGAYALLFGTDAFGATGVASMPNSPSEQPDIPPTTINSYMTYGIPRPGSPQKWRVGLGSGRRMFVLGTTVGLSADFDIDGDVDQSDLTLWETSFGSSAAADSNDNGLSDGIDFLAWQRQETGEEAFLKASQGVPEPSTGTLGFLTLCGLLGSWRKFRETAYGERKRIAPQPRI